jgi:hypothetical protein
MIKNNLSRRSFFSSAAIGAAGAAAFFTPGAFAEHSSPSDRRHCSSLA